jgi:hypothetical protein
MLSGDALCEDDISGKGKVPKQSVGVYRESPFID